ncbi:MAG: hypothetical protein AUG51_06125 [Acidobacteria bacterium 13_1_20CM_3_53_8]|nr:MAG: hypothetical protein AUG51_06125 [Acidobacteria bacterium 13_1_20CM_3_53_8]
MMNRLDERAQILIIDDDAEIRGLLCEILNPEHDCAQAASAEAAIEILRVKKFDLILSDIFMSGMNGLDLIPRVVELSPDTVIITISGEQTIDNAIQAMRVGAFDFITKPFDVTHIEASVRRALNHHDLRVAKRLYEQRLEELVAQRTAELDRALISLEESYRGTLKALVAALGTRDSETHGHSDRVVRFSLRLGRELGLAPEEMRSLEFGALLHDVGKIGVPDAILRKPSGLTDEEWKLMRQHPRYGEEILRGIDFLKGAAHVVGQHHERWDGTGYPRRLSGEGIDIKARIFSVADAFDAMISDRVYRMGTAYENVRTELERCAGQQFDHKVVEAFCRVAPEEWEHLRERSNKEERAYLCANASDPDVNSCTSIAPMLSESRELQVQLNAS